VSTATIIAGFVVSTVGFSIFLFGKKQRRMPQLAVGIAMMASPLIVTDPLWMSVTAVILLIGMHVAIRCES